MSLPRSVADVLGQHVTLQVESIDRMYLNFDQPRLQYDRSVVNFFRILLLVSLCDFVATAVLGRGTFDVELRTRRPRTAVATKIIAASPRYKLDTLIMNSTDQEL